MTPCDGENAVRFARKVIESETGKGSMPQIPDEGFDARSGVFVTLNTHPEHELRGCIGIPYPVMPLSMALEEAARSACHDPRFPDLSADEVDGVTVEVTILSEPVPICLPASELPSAIEIGRDGLMIAFRGRRGLFLPQVPVEQGWDTLEYLDMLCVKAGLPPGTWRMDDAEISSFRGEIFHEVSPNGEIMKG